MREPEFLLGAPAWIWPAVVVTAFFVGLTVVGYWRRGDAALGDVWRWAALGTKLLGVGILAMCLMAPMARGVRPKPQANLLPIVVDQSVSMQVHTSKGREKFSSKVVDTLEGPQPWRTTIEQLFDVRLYRFGQRLERTNQFEGLQFDAPSSNLGAALTALVGGYRGRPVAGCLLFTDGNATDRSDLEQLKELPFPICIVSDLRQSENRDLRIATVVASESDFETSPITIDAKIVSQGFDGDQAIVWLIDESGNEIERQSVELKVGVNEYPVRFRFRPKQSGVTFYRVQTRLGQEASLGNAPDLDAWNKGPTAEVTLLNNQKWVVVNQRRGPFGILYVSGRPNWEFKYLRRSLDEDAELNLVGLLRIAKSQPKFSFRDSKVQSSANPLFAGLGGEEEEIAEQLDEAVLLRIGVEESSQLAGGFPDEAEELFPYSAVILDDVEASFFTQDQLLLLRQFVTLRGGTLLVLGGEESFKKGEYDQGVLGELVPVYVGNGSRLDDDAGFAKGGQYQLNLTREGMLQPFLRLRNTEEAEAERLRQMPPLKVLNRSGRIKPGAVVLATAQMDTERAEPALVAQSFGNGKTAAFLAGDIWRWFLQRPEQAASRETTAPTNLVRDDPSQFWRQLSRWLVSDVPRQVEAEVAVGDTSETIRISTGVRDAAFEPVDGVKVVCRIQPPSGDAFEIASEPDLNAAGRYSTEYWPREPGIYRAMVTALDDAGEILGTDEVGWVSDPSAQEVERPGVDLALMEDLANRSGGRLFDITEIDQVVDLFESQPVPVEEVWVYPIWHRWWICLLAIACLCSEWGIRRWKGMH